MPKAPKDPKALRSNLVKRACDACKVRKTKCSETLPCNGCVSSGIACTFKSIQLTRGPRSLRAKTIQKISKTQTDEVEPVYRAPTVGGSNGSLSPTVPDFSYPEPRSKHENGVPVLLEALEVYRLRLFPIWPIVDVDELRMQLPSTDDQRFRLLATAIRIATTAQLDLESISPEDVPWTSLEDGDGSMDLNSLRIAFFLHIYNENQAPGGGKSLLYLRQAVTMAQVMRLDRESAYAGLPESEQQMRRRILWLLFVTERGVAMLHKMPAVLKPNIAFPYPGVDDQAHVLPAFLKLINLFWVFDQSGIFEILQNSDSDMSKMATTARGCLDLLQLRLQEPAVGYESSNDVQKADIFVTRQWMRAVLWRAAASFGMTSLTSSPIGIAREFLSFVTQLPTAAIEAHGPTIEFKTYDIATAVIDAVTSSISINPGDHPEEVLQGLQRVLSSSRGGNKALLASLYFKMAAITPRLQAPLSVGRLEEVTDETRQRHGGSSPNGSMMLPSAWAELEEILAHTDIMRTSSNGSPNYHSLEQQNQQMSWPPLDFSSPLIRTPSPLTRAVFDQISGNGDEYTHPLVSAWNGTGS